MDLLLLLLRIGLAGVMALAGFAKLADLPGSRRAFEGFGLSGVAAKFGPIALSLVEIAVAALLLFPQVSWYGAIGAVVLLALFIAQMAYQLAKGNSPDCHCFGQVYSAPVSPLSVVRNVVFAIPATVLVVRGRSAQGAAITDPGINTLELVFALVITALLIGIAAFLRKILERQDKILRELEIMDIVSKDGGTVERNEAGAPRDGMPIGAVVPDFNVKDLDGRGVTLADLQTEALPVLFLFVSPNCTPCRSMMPDFRRWIDDLDGKVTLAFLSSGTVEDNREKFGDQIADHLYLQETREVAAIFRANWTPSAVLVGRNGRIASQIAAGDQAIRTLVETIGNEDLQREGVFFTNGKGTPSTAPVGSPVPEFRLFDTEGREVTHESLRGRSSLLTFWSPSCPYCKEMVKDIEEWEKVKGKDDPNLFLLTPEADSLELTSTVVIDPQLKTAAALGMSGTPSAILVNEKGIVASETAIGAADIWSLIARRK